MHSNKSETHFILYPVVETTDLNNKLTHCRYYIRCRETERQGAQLVMYQRQFNVKQVQAN